MTLPYLETAKIIQTLTTRTGTIISTPTIDAASLGSLVGMTAVNVLAMGADPTGGNDSQPAIVAAIALLETLVGSATSSGIVFFPPGTYTVLSAIPLSLNSNNSIIFMGCGNASCITGTINGYIFDKTGTAGSGDEIRKFSQLFINNYHSSGGCIRLFGAWPTIVHDCSLQGNIGITAGLEADSSGGNTTIEVSNCNLRGLGYGTSGYAVSIGGSGSGVIKCDIKGFGSHGVEVTFGPGNYVVGNRMEICLGFGVAVGVANDGTWSSADGTLVAANSQEGNVGGIFLRGSSCVIEANVVHGEEANGSAWGYYVDNGTNITLQNNSFNGDLGCDAAVLGSITGSVLTVTATSGTITVGLTVFAWGGASLTVTITSFGTGSGGAGTYNLSGSPGSSSGQYALIDTATTRASVYIPNRNGTDITQFRITGYNGFISSHGVVWNVNPTGGVQFKSTNYVPGSTHTFANKPIQPVDGDEVIFVDCPATPVASCTAGTITGTTTLTVGGTVTGFFRIGTIISGTSVTAGTTITALGTGIGGAGTYTVTTSSNAGSTTITGSEVVAGATVAGGGSNRVRAEYSSSTSSWKVIGPG